MCAYDYKFKRFCVLGLRGKIFALSYAGMDLFRHSQWKVIENEGQQFNLRLSLERVALQ